MLRVVLRVGVEVSGDVQLPELAQLRLHFYHARRPGFGAPSLIAHQRAMRSSTSRARRSPTPPSDRTRDRSRRTGGR